MREFKVGDAVTCIRGPHKGERKIVKEICDKHRWIQLKGEGFRTFNPACWELVAEADSKRRPHYDIIIAWANGAEVETRSCGGVRWVGMITPTFAKDRQYRVKEDPKQSEIKSIREEMDKLASRLKELE